jgi:hypothetical protein
VIAEIDHLCRRYARASSFVLACTLLASCGQSLYGDDAGSTEASIDVAMSQAKEWTSAAAGNSSGTLKSKANAVLTKLKNHDTQLVGEDDPDCYFEGNPYVLAFVELPANSESKIYVCPEGLKNGNDLLSQVFVHEAVHLTGVGNECTTTSYEIQILAAAGQRPYENGYFSGCVADGDLDASDFEDVDFRAFLGGNRLIFLHGP